MTDKLITHENIVPFKLYLGPGSRSTFLVYLGIQLDIPYFDDCVASAAAMKGSDLEDKTQYDIWPQACLCWNVLEERHEFHNPLNLRELNSQDGHIPFDNATGRMRATLSLLKYAQDKCYKKEIFSTDLNKPI